MIWPLYEQVGGSDGVAAGVSAEGGDVGGAGQAVTADGEVVQAGHDGWRVRCGFGNAARRRSRRGSSAACSRSTNGLDDRGELVGVDVAEAEVGDRVDGFGMSAAAGGGGLRSGGAGG